MMKPLYIIQSILTREEMNALLMADGHTGQAGVMRHGESVIDGTRRSTTIKMVDPNDFPSINEKIMKLAAEFDSDFDPEANYVKEYNFLIYEKGDHFTWHRDRIKPDEDGQERRYSSSTILSLTQDLEGGEFGIQSNDGSQNALTLDAGETLMFDARTRHCVYEVTKGKRIVLVAWIYNK